MTHLSHDKEKIPVTTKFRLLKKALKGAAASVVGHLLSTPSNYTKVWERLSGYASSCDEIVENGAYAGTNSQ